MTNQPKTEQEMPVPCPNCQGWGAYFCNWDDPNWICELCRGDKQVTDEEYTRYYGGLFSIDNSI